jgi:hypothetical protein
MVCQWFGLKTTGMVFSGLASKPVETVSPGLTSKLMARVFRFGSQNRQLRFGDLSLKITAMVSWFVSCTTKSTEGGWRGTRVKI